MDAPPRAKALWGGPGIWCRTIIGDLYRRLRLDSVVRQLDVRGSDRHLLVDIGIAIDWALHLARHKILPESTNVPVRLLVNVAMSVRVEAEEPHIRVVTDLLHSFIDHGEILQEVLAAL